LISNDAWQKYYETGENKPDETKLNLESEIDRILETKEKKKSEAQRQEQYQNEIDEVFKEPDIEEVLPVFKELMEEYDGVPKATPKKLYERARIQIKVGKTKDFESIEKEVEDRVKRELAKREAVKSSGASGSSIASKPEEKLSPEIADLYRDIT